jgi:hypothetical protein
VVESGGSVYHHVALKEVLLEEVGANTSGTSGTSGTGGGGGTGGTGGTGGDAEIQATGVAVSLSKRGPQGAGEVENEVVFSASKSVISGIRTIYQTYIIYHISYIIHHTLLI